MKFNRQIHALLHGLCLLLTGCLLMACHDKREEELPVPKRRTVILYMAAENSLSRFAQYDLNEVEQAAKDIPLDCNLVVYLDDTQLPAVYTYDAQTGKSLWKKYPERDSCDSLNFRQTLRDIIRAFPAQHYGLILWSHGSGWIPQPTRTIGIDNNQNSNTDRGSQLEIPVMRRMLESLGVHWDYIFFDACFMQCVELDYELRKVCDAVVASPAEIPGNGAPYDAILPHLFADTDGPERLCQTYFDAYTSSSGLVISLTRSSEMEGLAQATRPLVVQAFSGRQNINLRSEEVQTYCPYALRTSWKPEYYDMGSVLKYLTLNPVDYQLWRAQLDRAVPLQRFTHSWMSIYRASSYDTDNFRPVIVDADNLACVSLFVPNEKYETMNYNLRLRDYEWYKAAGWDLTGW